MVDYYLYAKKLISKKMSEDDYLYPFFVCAFYGLLSKYRGNGALISNLFRKTNFILEKGTIPEIIQRHNLDLDIIESIPDGVLQTLATSNQGHGFIPTEDGDMLYVKENPFVICSLSQYNPSRLLNAFCHEMGHLIKGERDDHSFHNEDGTTFIIIRTGLSHYIYSYQYPSTELNLTSSCSALDEAVNCIQTTDVMQEILALGEYVDDPKIKGFIDSLDKDFLQKDAGYGDLVDMIRPLWESETFRNMVENHVMYDEIDDVVAEFDSIAGEGSFEAMASYMDQALEAVEQEDEQRLDEIAQQFAKLILAYRKGIKTMGKD